MAKQTSTPNAQAQRKYVAGGKTDLKQLKASVIELTEVVSALVVYAATNASPEHSKDAPTHDQS